MFSYFYIFLLFFPCAAHSWSVNVWLSRGRSSVSFGVFRSGLMREKARQDAYVFECEWERITSSNVRKYLNVVSSRFVCVLLFGSWVGLSWRHSLHSWERGIGCVRRSVQSRFSFSWESFFFGICWLLGIVDAGIFIFWKIVRGQGLVKKRNRKEREWEKAHRVERERTFNRNIIRG